METWQEHFFIFFHMASFGVYVPDGDELLNRIQAVADAQHGGKVSAYARAAIERDLSGQATTDAMSPTIVVDLTRQLLGEPAAQLMAEVFARSPRPDAQARFLRRVLQHELAAFEAAEAHIEEQQAPYGPLFVNVPKPAAPPGAQKKKA